MPLAKVAVRVEMNEALPGYEVSAEVRTLGVTGVEMEALTAVSIAAHAIVDMVKGVDRSAEITDCKIIHKAGGRSGDWYRPGYEA